MKAKKLIASLVFNCFLLSSSLAQNAIGVSNIQSPQNLKNYNSNISEDIRVFVQNKGPERILGTDSIYFSYNISNKDTSIFLQKTMIAGQIIDTGKGAAYTLHQNYNFAKDNHYSVCAEVIGTKHYPSNIAKQRSACSNFTVSLFERKLAASKLYYSKGVINYSLATKQQCNLKLFDLSGKLIWSKQLNKKAGKINCNDLNPALYLLNLSTEEGNHKTIKVLIQ